MEPLQGAVVVVAKCPIPGESKTRLQPLLGEEGASRLARAMLSDTLVALSSCDQFRSVKKVLLYAPATGLDIMEGVLNDLQIRDEWKLEPMLEGSLQDIDLGSRLADSLLRMRQVLSNDAPVVFLGMDSPEVPLDEVISALQHPDRAHLCPSDDGGYGLLSVPHQAPAEGVFQNIQWSHLLTALSQLKSLTDHKVNVTLGRLMHDIDTPDDVQRFCERLRGPQALSSGDCLLKSTQSSPKTIECRHTIRVLQEMGHLE